MGTLLKAIWHNISTVQATSKIPCLSSLTFGWGELSLFVRVSGAGIRCVIRYHFFKLLLLDLDFIIQH